MRGISFVLSGGVSNRDPAKSLGGQPSGKPVIGIQNNLFSDVGRELAISGTTDYRCFYVINNSEKHLWGNLDVFLNAIPSNADIQIGIPLADEVQQITFNGATGGSFSIAYRDSKSVVNYSADPTTLADNIQRGIRRLSNLQSVEVSSIGANTFNVLFTGTNGNRSHPLLQAVDVNLGGGTVLIQKIAVGSPINSTANQISSPTQVPFGIEFTQPFAESPISLGLVSPGDYFFIWVRRVIPKGSLDSTGVTFGIGFFGTFDPPPDPVIYDFFFGSTGGIGIFGDAYSYPSHYDVFGSGNINIGGEAFNIDVVENPPP